MDKCFYLVDERRKKEKERLERLRKTLIKRIKGAFLELSRMVSFREAYIFGSIINPKAFSTQSDVDIAFYGLQEKDFLKTMTFLSRYLDRDVDVLQLEGHRLEEKITGEGIKWKG